MTTLIKNATIIDGTRKPPFKGDIFIKNDVISAVGSLGRQSAKKVINVSGQFAAPGFIDANSSSDHYLTLFSNPEQQDFLLQGVTTIFGGLCGSSLAPLLYGELLSIRKWVSNVSRINIDWKSVNEFLLVLKRRGLGVNFGTLVGHSTVRRGILGENLRDLTDSELAVFEKMLLDSLNDGAFGLSTGLGYVHARNTPHHEIKRLVHLVSRKGGLYATHLRNEGRGLLASLTETINIAKETGAKILINHLRPLKGFEAEYSEGLTLLCEETKDASIYFDLYPFEMSHVALYSFLPEWAQNGGMEIMLENIKNKSIREKIISDVHILGDGDNITIASAPNSEYLVGKTLKSFAEKRDVSIIEGLLRLMELTGFKSTVFYKNINLELTKKSLVHEMALVSGNSISTEPGAYKSERSTKTFTKFLDLVLREKLLSIETAIAKLTAVPASLYGLKNRGLLKEGMKADITIFSFDDKTGVEIQHVLINGEHAVENKTLKVASAGEILRKT